MVINDMAEATPWPAWPRGLALSLYRISSFGTSFHAFDRSFVNLRASFFIVAHAQLYS